jgi:hypothetical protein
MTDARRRVGLIRNDLRALRRLAKDKAAMRVVDHAESELQMLEIEMSERLEGSENEERI